MCIGRVYNLRNNNTIKSLSRDNLFKSGFRFLKGICFYIDSVTLKWVLQQTRVKSMSFPL